MSNQFSIPILNNFREILPRCLTAEDSASQSASLVNNSDPQSPLWRTPKLAARRAIEPKSRHYRTYDRYRQFGNCWLRLQQPAPWDWRWRVRPGLYSYGLETIAHGKFSGSGVPVTMSTPDGIASVGRVRLPRRNVLGSRWPWWRGGGRRCGGRW